MTLSGLALSRAGTDRAGQHRTDEAWLTRAWDDPATLVLAVAGGRVLAVHDGTGPAALRLTPSALSPPGERYLLGVDPEGVVYFAVGVDALPFLDGDDAVEAGLRELGSVLDDRQVGLLAHAVALDNWHRTHTHCSRCGTPTVVEAAGHTRRCPADGSEHYPRTDPAVIMAVVDADDRLLLGHQAAWPAGRFSTLAGFVEPGESLEHAVAREVYEETAVVTTTATYLGSQPWPFPSSLMVGFLAEAETTEIVTDDVEIVQARWFTRDELRSTVEAGEILLPPPVSIARRLIEHWYGGAVRDAGGTWR